MSKHDNILHAQVKPAGDTPRNADGFRINSTLWGYVLLSAMAHEKPRMAVILTRRFIAAVLVLAALAMWVVPNAVLGADIASMKLGLTVLYLALGFWFFYMPRQVLRREVQVNLTRGELRLGFRNKAGIFSLQAVHAFADVDIVVLWQPEKERELATLYLRLRGTGVGIVAARGPVGELMPLKGQLAKDLGTQVGGFNPASVAVAGQAVQLLLGPRMESSGLKA